MESKLTDFVYFSLENRQIRVYSKSNKAFHASAQACANGKASFFEGDCGVKSYNKPTLSIKEQIDLFLARGLDIPDKKEPERFLSSVSYYRLRGYTYWMQLNALRLHSGRKNVIRNICAHHGRLWDRVVTQVPKFTPQLSSPWIPSFYDPRTRYAIVTLKAAASVVSTPAGLVGVSESGTG